MMNEGLIQKIVRRQNLNILAASVLGLAVVAALFAFNLNYWTNFISGPAETSPATLLGAASAADLPRYWIHIQGEELLDTGFQYVSKSKSGAETVESSYFALVLEDKLLVVKMEGEPGEEKLVSSLTGWLSELTSQENNEVIQKTVADVPALKGHFLPYKLDTSDFRVGGLIGLAAGGLVALLCLWGFMTGLRRMGDPDSHPIMKKLARFGPLDIIVPGIEADLAASHPVSGKVHFTNGWLVYAESANLQAARYADVAWIYKHVLTRKSYGITTGKTFTVIVNDTFGEKLSFVTGGKEPACNEVLAGICQRAPWAVAGYSAELEQAWRKDRPGFLAAVERRKTAAPAA